MTANTWPGGQRHAMSQDDHEHWNARHYPGTRQLCILCDEPTGRCEEDELYVDDEGPLCETCWTERQEREPDALTEGNKWLECEGGR